MATEHKAFYLKEPYIYLLNPNMLPNDLSVIRSFPVGLILPAFVKEMKKESEDHMDFKILGTVLNSSVKIHRSKIDLVIKHQLRVEAREQKKRRESRFDPTMILPVWYLRPQMVMASEKQRMTFYEELLIVFEEAEELSRRRTRKKAERKTKRKPVRQTRRRRKITADLIDNFDYVMDFDNAEVDELVDQILDSVVDIYERLNRTKKKHQGEISFETIFSERVRFVSRNFPLTFDRLQLERVRTLMAILFLVQEGRVEAWQDEDSSEITITLLPQILEGVQATS